MDRLFIAFGSISGLIAVGAGAIAAHGLKSRVTPDMLAIFETGVRFQMYHALALLGAAWCVAHLGGKLPVAAGWLFIAGSVCFSGSLYYLAVTGARLFGMVAPMGGFMLMAGWLCLAVAALKQTS